MESVVGESAADHAVSSFEMEPEAVEEDEVVRTDGVRK